VGFGRVLFFKIRGEARRGAPRVDLGALDILLGFRLSFHLGLALLPGRLIVAGGINRCIFIRGALDLFGSGGEGHSSARLAISRPGRAIRTRASKGISSGRTVGNPLNGGRGIVAGGWSYWDGRRP